MLGAPGALDGDGRLTEIGTRPRPLPLPPRPARPVSVASATDPARAPADLAAVRARPGPSCDGIHLDQRVWPSRRDRRRRIPTIQRVY
ncbi:ATP-dependent helicase HrpB, partial [Methylobacterium sp. J-001]|nr:ATP-dependent helicase HrpB [Methylobacterium sp. J-001]